MDVLPLFGTRMGLELSSHAAGRLTQRLDAEELARRRCYTTGAV